MVKTLQKPNTCLFRDQVYKKLEEKLIHLHPIEEALRKINRDEKLQAIIKNYAIKYSLERDTEGYYLLGDRDRGIFFWNDTGNRLYIGPDQNEDIAPIFFRRGVPAREDGPYTGYDYTNFQLLEENNGFYLTGPPKDELSGKKITSVGILFELSEKQILKGLKEAVNKLLEEQI